MPDDQPSRMLAVLLGASTFPNAPKLAEGRAFYNSAADVKEYLGEEQGLALPRQNILSLFDDSHSAPEQLVEVAKFLERRTRELKSEGFPPEDLLIYYVGHGLFTRGDQAYCFAVRSTDEIDEGATSIRASNLAGIIKEKAAFLRRFLILDCCFAASIHKEFQSGALTAARVQIGNEFPERGTALLCSSNAREPSLAPQGLDHTMFSNALIQALRQGHKSGGPRLSFSELGDLIKENLRTAYPDSWVRPEVHSPDQRAGDIAHIPLFPNPAYGEPEAVESAETCATDASVSVGSQPEEREQQRASERTRLEQEKRKGQAAAAKARLDQQERHRLAATERARLEQIEDREVAGAISVGPSGAGAVRKRIEEAPTSQATRSGFLSASPSWVKYASLGAVILVAAALLYYVVVPSPGVPSITSLSPATGPPGTVVTISGKNFGANQGGSMVRFGNATVPVSSWSGTSSVVTVPKAAVGPANVVVSVNNKDSAPVTFTVSGAPVATSLSPASGPAGTTVTISGVDFGATQGNSTVRFGSVTAPITYWSEDSIAAKVPELRQGPGNVVVSVNGVDSAPLRFTVGHVVPSPGPVINKSVVNSPEYQQVKDHLMQTQAQAQAVLGQWNRTAAEVARNGGSLRSDEQTALNLLRGSMSSASRSLQAGDLAGATHSLNTADQQIKLLQQYAE